jgi:transketolase
VPRKSNDMTSDATRELARRSRVSTVHAVHTGKSSHVGSSLSVIDILAVLYGRVANVTPDNLDDADRDIVIVSKGHAAAGTYSVLANAGIIPLDWLEGYSQDGTRLGGHVTSSGVPGVELSTGSLGHGLPVGIGSALAARRTGNPRQVYVVMSDGECDEGTTWESALLAPHHRLDNLTIAIDRNGLQSLTTTEQTLALEPFADKWRAFGWDVHEIDGHDHDALAAALTRVPGDSGGRPRVVICTTTKGKGVSYMENQVLWHYKTPDADQVRQAVEDIGS